MKKLSTATTIFLMAMAVTFMPEQVSAQYVSNQFICLSMDSTNSTGNMAFMENRCNFDVDVKYCFGNYTCDTRPGATTVSARDRKTVYREHRKYPHRQLIAFACRADVDFADCQNAKNEFFQTRWRD